MIPERLALSHSAAASHRGGRVGALQVPSQASSVSAPAAFSSNLVQPMTPSQTLAPVRNHILKIAGHFLSLHPGPGNRANGQSAPCRGPHPTLSRAKRYSTRYSRVVTQLAKRYSTRYSRVVTQRSTDLAQSSLPSVIGRERGYSGWYDRSMGCAGFHVDRLATQSFCLSPGPGTDTAPARPRTHSSTTSEVLTRS